MHKRYQSPSFGPPTPAQLPNLLSDAMPTLNDFPEEERAAVETRRIEALDALLRFARSEAGEARAKMAEARAKMAEARANVETVRGHDFRDAVLTLVREPYLLTDLAARGRGPQQYVWEFLTEAGLRILTASDPVAELHQFLGVSRQRGRPRADNTWRDFVITIDVQERVDDGSSVEAACAEIGDDANLSPEAVEKIYYTHRGKPGVHDKRAREQLLKYVQSLEPK
jgi:hypothetical protein